jgi:hypothetical protein
MAYSAAIAFVVCALALIVSALPGQSADKSQSSNKSQWPTTEERENVKLGFTKALTRSATDQEFRGRLLDFANQQKVKAAIQEEFKKVPGLESMRIPDDIVLIFYVPQKGLGKTENRNLHVFHLPDYDPNDTAEHKYDLHIKCCYNPW